MKQKFILTSIVFILIVGISLRFYKLGSTPNSLDWDEASWGYNAYSLLKTGKDEYGIPHPSSFRSFGDYKQPVYGYLVAGSEAIFGPTPYAVRFPSALFGSLSILAFFYFLRELFRKTQRGDLIALFATASYALSPWAIQFSRVGFEANVALALFIIGLASLIRGLKRYSFIFSVIGSVILALSEYTYHSEKITSPLLFICLILFVFFQQKVKKPLLLVTIIVFLILSSLWLFDSNTTARGRSVLFTSNTTQVLGRTVEEMNYEKSIHSPFASMIHNRRIVYAMTFSAHYLSHFDPKYLFLTGDNERHHAPDMGLLYLISLPFIFIGIIMAIKRDFRAVWFVFAWFLLAPLTSALTIDPPNAARNLIMAPTWDIFIGLGMYYFWTFFNMKKRYYFIPLLAGILLIGNVTYYLHQYFVHTNQEYDQFWQYGYKEAMTSLDSYRQNHRLVYIPDDIEQGYVYYLFFTRYDPEKYSSRPNANAQNQDCRKIENLYFGKCPVVLQPGDIYVTSTDINFSAKELKRINYANGLRSVGIYERL